MLRIDGLERRERQVCAMVRPPTREAEDARRLSRERETLVTERTRHANRIKGGVAAGSVHPQGEWKSHGRLLATQGSFDFEPIWKDRRARLDALRTLETSILPPRLKREILRQLHRLDLVMQQIAAVEARPARRNATQHLGADPLMEAIMPIATDKPQAPALSALILA